MFPSMNRLLLVCRTAEARKAVEVCGMAGCSMLSAMPLDQFLFSIPEFFPFRPKGYHARGGIVVLSGGSPSSPWGATQAEGVAEAVRSIHFSGMATDPLAYLAAGGVFVVEVALVLLRSAARGGVPMPVRNPLGTAHSSRLLPHNFDFLNAVDSRVGALLLRRKVIAPFRYDKARASES